jgi:hypothetical protein
MTMANHLAYFCVNSGLAARPGFDTRANVVSCIWDSPFCSEMDSMFNFVWETRSWVTKLSNVDVLLSHPLSDTVLRRMMDEPDQRCICTMLSNDEAPCRCSVFDRAMKSMFLQFLYSSEEDVDLESLVTDLILIRHNITLCVCDPSGEIGAQCVYEPPIVRGFDRLPAAYPLLLIEETPNDAAGCTVRYNLMCPVGTVLFRLGTTDDVFADHKRVCSAARPFSLGAWVH